MMFHRQGANNFGRGEPMCSPVLLSIRTPEFGRGAKHFGRGEVIPGPKNFGRGEPMCSPRGEVKDNALER